MRASWWQPVWAMTKGLLLGLAIAGVTAVLPEPWGLRALVAVCVIGFAVALRHLSDLNAKGRELKRFMWVAGHPRIREMVDRGVVEPDMTPEELERAVQHEEARRLVEGDRR